MRIIFNGLICLFLSLPAMAQTAGVTLPECEIDEIANQNYARAERITESIIDQISSKPDTEGAACLPALQNVGKKIGASLPSFSMGDLVETFSKAACKAANSAISSMISSLNTSVKAPYGMGSVDVGLDNQGKWADWKEPEIQKSSGNGLKFVEDFAEDLGESVGNKVTAPLKGVRDSVDTFDNQIQRENRQRNNEIRGVVNNAKDI